MKFENLPAVPKEMTATIVKNCILNGSRLCFFDFFLSARVKICKRLNEMCCFIYISQLSERNYYIIKHSFFEAAAAAAARGRKVRNKKNIFNSFLIFFFVSLSN
jgi:hypothetical protein